MDDQENLIDEVHRISEELERITQTTQNLENAAASAARIATLEECQKAKDSIDEQIEKRFRSALILAGVLLAVLGSFGYLGLKTTLPQIVEKSLNTSVQKEIEILKNEANEALNAIRIAQRVAKANPLITLQTDFGNTSAYMGALMGVIYSINPHARLQVITSEIGDFDVLHAAWTLWRASRFYPRGTIFVVITNPGGLISKPVVIITKNGHVYIGHDNGCFDFVVKHYGHKASYTIASPELSPVKFKGQFGGVDIFGPTAARLSLGFPLAKIGPPTKNYTPKLARVQHTIKEKKITGTVMEVDKFGNVTTNITELDLEQIRLKIGMMTQVDFGVTHIEAPMKKTYGHVSKGFPVVIMSEGLLQLAINEDSFAEHYGISRRSQVTISYR